MGWEINFKDSAMENLLRFQKNMQQSIGKAIRDRLGIDPCRYKMLKGDLKECRRMRIGNYRVVYMTNEGKKTVEIIAIDVRSKIYQK